MANIQRPGFFPARVRGGGYVELNRRRALTNPSTGVFCGDVVKAVTDGDVLVASSGTAAILGVARGASYISNGERVERHYLPASTTYTSSGVNPVNASYIYTADTANIDFSCSADEALTLTSLYNNFGVVLGTGSTATGYSGQELDSSTVNTTATLPFRLVDFIFDGRNDVDAADVNVLVRINDGTAEPALNATAIG